MSTDYKVVTHTGANNLHSAVEIMFVSGTMPGTDKLWYTLNDLDRDDFEVNKTDEFLITTNTDLGDITDIKLQGWHGEDHWDLKSVKITRQGKSNPNTTIFTINKLLTKREELPWSADGTEGNPIVKMEPNQIERSFFTEYKLLDNSARSTSHTFEQTFSQKKSSQVTADETRSTNEEHSWFMQAGYAPSQNTGGVTFSGGYAGKIANSVEKKTGQSSGEDIEFSEKHSFEVPPGKLVLVKAEFVEVVKTGKVSYFNKELPFSQVSKIFIKEYKTTEYDNINDVPNEFRAQRTK